MSSPNKKQTRARLFKLRNFLTSNSSKNFAATIVFTPTNQKEHASQLVFRKDFSFKTAALIVDTVGPSRVLPLRPRK